MISASNVTLRIGKKALFEDVNIKCVLGKTAAAQSLKSFVIKKLGE